MSYLMRARGGNLYLGGVFKLELFLPEEYPMAAPKVPQSGAIPFAACFL